MVAGSRKDPVKGTEGADELRVGEELVRGVDAAHEKGVSRWDEEGEGEAEQEAGRRLTHALPKGRGQIVVRTGMVDDVTGPQDVHLVACPVELREGGREGEG